MPPRAAELGVALEWNAGNDTARAIVDDNGPGLNHDIGMTAIE